MKKIFKTLIFSLLANTIFANNIQLSNVLITNNNASPSDKLIEFTVSWENSWRSTSTPANWDGAWLFFKFKDNDGNWYPIYFTGNNITSPSNTAYEVGSNGDQTGVGIFIYRSANGSGTFTSTSFKAGVQSHPGTFEVRGFALEMVHVPQASYYLGDGSFSSTTHSFDDNGTPYQVLAGGITMGSLMGELDDPWDTYAGTLAGFPKGYTAFWQMKYELSVAGYRDFLNTLTYTQQQARIVVSPDSPIGTRLTEPITNSILEIKTPGINSVVNGVDDTAAIVGVDFDNDNIFDESTDCQWSVFLRVGWTDACAYLDWAGLRPMTELEFEKSCRGPNVAIINEYAWGTSAVASNVYNFVNFGQINETVSNASSVLGNAIYNTTKNDSYYGLHRVGQFATGVSTRVSAGAGYYGAMELSGSGSELCVTVQNAAGRSYTGKHGDGQLNAQGHANVNYWPGIVSGINTPNTECNGCLGVRYNGGGMTRGGNWNDLLSELSISTRKDAGFSYNGTAIEAPMGNIANSIRGVRDSSIL